VNQPLKCNAQPQSELVHLERSPVDEKNQVFRQIRRMALFGTEMKSPLRESKEMEAFRDGFNLKFQDGTPLKDVSEYVLHRNAMLTVLCIRRLETWRLPNKLLPVSAGLGWSTIPTMLIRSWS
jgi:hypothetical protein